MRIRDGLDVADLGRPFGDSHASTYVGFGGHPVGCVHLQYQSVGRHRRRRGVGRTSSQRQTTRSHAHGSRVGIDVLY